MTHGWVTPSLEFFVCNSTQEIIDTYELASLVPDLPSGDCIPVFEGLAKEMYELAIREALIDAGCLEVKTHVDQILFRGHEKRLRSAWKKCIELSQSRLFITFDIVKKGKR